MSSTHHGGESLEREAWATFWLGGEMFALRVEDVQEVLQQSPLTPVPLAPDHVVGLLNLRGQIMPALDLRRRLGFPARAPGADWFLLVVRASEPPIAVVVDGIGDVLVLPTQGWRPPPPTLGVERRRFVGAICPIEAGVVLGLRVEALGAESPDSRGGSR
jgi:purine-binding chemotaxis protein CheW